MATPNIFSQLGILPGDDQDAILSILRGAGNRPLPSDPSGSRMRLLSRLLGFGGRDTPPIGTPWPGVGPTGEGGPPSTGTYGGTPSPSDVVRGGYTPATPGRPDTRAMTPQHVMESQAAQLLEADPSDFVRNIFPNASYLRSGESPLLDPNLGGPTFSALRQRFAQLQPQVQSYLNDPGTQQFLAQYSGPVTPPGTATPTTPPVGGTPGSGNFPVATPRGGQTPVVTDDFLPSAPTGGLSGAITGGTNVPAPPPSSSATRGGTSGILRKKLSSASNNGQY